MCVCVCVRVKVPNLIMVTIKFEFLGPLLSAFQAVLSTLNLLYFISKFKCKSEPYRIFLSPTLLVSNQDRVLYTVSQIYWWLASLNVSQPELLVTRLHHMTGNKERQPLWHLLELKHTFSSEVILLCIPQRI